MKKKKKIMIFLIVLAILAISIGYAAVKNITLNVTGEVSADPKQENFTVKLTGTPTVSDKNYVTASITNNLNALMNVSGLTAKGDVVTATYTIENTSNDLTANLSATVTNSNSEYFKVSHSFAETALKKGKTTTLTVTVEVIKTPIQDTVTSTIGVQISAAPVQPE